MEKSKLFFIFSLLAFSIYGQSIARFTVQGVEISGIDTVRIGKMKAAMRVFENVMNDTAFQEEISKYIYHYDIDTDSHWMWTPQQVFKKIYEGKEFYKTEIDSTADLYWIIVKKRKPRTRNPARGYGYKNKKEIYTYTWFLDSEKIPEIAGHIAHEWSHKLGFIHKFHHHEMRDYTVPYAFGSTVAKYAKKYSAE